MSPAHQAFWSLLHGLCAALLCEAECSSCLSDAEVSSDHVLHGEAWQAETKNQAKIKLEHKEQSKRTTPHDKIKGHTMGTPEGPPTRVITLQLRKSLGFS